MKPLQEGRAHLYLDVDHHGRVWGRIRLPGELHERSILARLTTMTSGKHAGRRYYQIKILPPIGDEHDG